MSGAARGPALWARLVPSGARAHLARVVRHRGPFKRPREIAVLFVDIEGCTRLCEDLPPRDMNAVIEAYFSEYLDVVREAGGEVTEILGDGLLALFEGGGLRDNARAAFAAALAMQATTRRLNARRGRRRDPITVNMGLNAGSAWVGFTRLRGRSGERWAYAAGGPVTNVAARLCALARDGQVLTTRATAELFEGGDRRPLGRHRLKNVAGLVDVVEIRPPRRGEGQHTARAAVPRGRV